MRQPLGYYGNRGEEILTEKNEKGRGFLVDVCAEREGATRNVVGKGIRTFNLRVGIVLDDVVRMIDEVIQQTHLSGPVNVANSYPVTNRPLSNINHQFFRKKSNEGTSFAARGLA